MIDTVLLGYILDLEDALAKTSPGEWQVERGSRTLSTATAVDAGYVGLGDLAEFEDYSTRRGQVANAYDDAVFCAVVHNTLRELLPLLRDALDKENT